MVAFRSCRGVAQGLSLGRVLVAQRSCKGFRGVAFWSRNGPAGFFLGLRFGHVLVTQKFTFSFFCARFASLESSSWVSQAGTCGGGCRCWSEPPAESGKPAVGRGWSFLVQLCSAVHPECGEENQGGISHQLQACRPSRSHSQRDECSEPQKTIRM